MATQLKYEKRPLNKQSLFMAEEEGFEPSHQVAPV
jgi:hypothetical protein